MGGGMNSKSVVQTDSQVTYSGKQMLLDSEIGLENYNFDIVKKLSKGFGISKNQKVLGEILELGAGTGTLAEIWRREFSMDPICVEIDPQLVKILKSKKFRTFSNLKSINAKLPIIYSSNTLEHIEDDLKTLKQIRERLKPGGILGLYVPALPFLFSDFDREVGHFRRYKKRELINLVKRAGFEVENCYFNDSIGVIASLVVKIFGYNKDILGSKKSLILYDKYIYFFSKILDKMIFKHLIGKNLFLFAKNVQHR
jgi:SAM-dependent methyltransferase